MAVASLHRLAGLSWSDRFLLAEALVALAVSSAAIRLLPFRRVVGAAAVLGRPVRGGDQGGEPTRKVVWAVLAAARRVPWKAVCFQRGLAVHVMLRRRGIASFLHYGVAQEGSDRLKAHVWVSDAAGAVIGGEEAAGFTCLATYPALPD